MKFRIQLLRSRGVKLDRGALLPPQWCDVRVGDLSHVARDRGIRAAQAFALDDYGGGIKREVFPPLFEPRVAVMDPKCLVLTGVEINTIDGAQMLVGQAWRCLPCPDAGGKE